MESQPNNSTSSGQIHCLLCRCTGQVRDFLDTKVGGDSLVTSDWVFVRWVVKVKISSSMHDYIRGSQIGFRDVLQDGCLWSWLWPVWNGSEGSGQSQLLFALNTEWNFRNHPLSWKQFNHFALHCIDFFLQRKSPNRPIFFGQIVRDRWQSCLRCCLCPDPSCMMLSAGVLFTGGRPCPGLQGWSELEH